MGGQRLACMVNVKDLYPTERRPIKPFGRIIMEQTYYYKKYTAELRRPTINLFILTTNYVYN